MKILLCGLNAKFVHTNIGIRYIKSYCSEYDISIKEYTINNPLDSILSDIYGTGAEVVGFSCYIWNIDVVLKLCSSLKKINPSIVIILGGPEVSFESAKLMEEHNFIDYILKGEGEISSKQLFAFIEEGTGGLSAIGGLVYKNKGCIEENKESGLIKDLDSIPFPYVDEDLENKILYYESSRGCPYNCSYCLSSTIRGVRSLSLERIKKDLLWFIDRGVGLVKFVDRTFNCSKYSLEIFKFLAENSKNTRFHFEISADILDEKTIQFLNTVPRGLFQFEIGVQSTNETTIRLIDRRVSFERLSNNVIKLRKPGNIHLHLDLIAGLPEESFESFKKSFNDVMMLRPHMLQMGFLKMLKGSRIRKDAESFGIVFADYSPYEVMKTEVLSFEELSDLKNIEDVVERYYNSGRFNASLTYLMNVFNSPFEIFRKLKDFQGSMKQSNQNLSNIEQYRLLYDFSKNTGCYTEIFKECLAFDYLAQGRNPAVPDFLMPDEKVDRHFIWDFLSDKNNVKKYLPHYDASSIKDIVKYVYVRKFSFDICTYINHGEVNLVKRYVFFDYGYKNIMQKDNYFCI